MITAGLVTSFKSELLAGVHDLLTDNIKIALYDDTAVLDPGTTLYTTTGEVSSAGYTAGGLTLSGPIVSSGNGTGFAGFDDPIWYGTTFSVRGALIYNATKADKAIAVLNFGINQVTIAQDFKIQFPTTNAETALIRIT